MHSKNFIIVLAVIVVLGLGAYWKINKRANEPPPGTSFTPTELKYRIIQRFGPEVGDGSGIFYCDPDFYPIAFRDEQELALERFPEIQNNTEEFQAILKTLSLSPATSFPPEQKLFIYREHKKLKAFVFEPFEERYLFEVRTVSEKGLGLGEGETIKGTIDSLGYIRITERERGFIVTCPICLAASVVIDTPSGSVPVSQLKAGMSVWTLEGGNRIPAVILRISKVKAPPDHKILHIVLHDGREIFVSPGHPTATGEPVGKLKSGDFLDGAKIINFELLPYEGGFTYDILPSGPTGLYRANGILLKSTLIE